MSAVLSLTPVTSVIILLLFASQVYYYQRHSSYVKQTDLRLQTLASERDELRDRHASRKQECDLVETRLHECSKRAVSAEEKFDHIKVDCDEQKRKLDAFKGVDVTYLQRRIAELQKLLEEQKSQWQQVKGLEADAARREHDEVLQACEVHRQDAHRLTAQLDVIKHERDNMQKLLRSQDDDLTEMREKRSVSQAELAACDSERAAAVRSTQRLTKELDAVVSSAGVKHEAAQALKERHLFDVQAQLKAAQSDARRARDELDESRAEHEACEKRLVSMAPLAADAVVSAAAGATDAAAPTLDASGYCANSPTERGRWSADGRFAPLGCRYRAYGSIEAGQCLARKRVMLIGDATMKDFAYALYQLLSETVGAKADKASFCRALKREHALVGCSFEIASSGVLVEYYIETTYQSSLLRSTIGEVKSVVPDIVIFGVGVDGAIRERTQWRDLLLAQAAPLMQWVERQFRGGRLFYWRTNPALSMRLKRPSTPADINDALAAADRTMRALVLHYNRPILDVAPSTRAPGADALYSDERLHYAMSPTHVNMWLNLLCNARLNVTTDVGMDEE